MNKASGNDRIPAELFKTLKDDAIKVLHYNIVKFKNKIKKKKKKSAALNMSANLENSAVATGLEMISFHSIPKRGNAKECSNYSCTHFTY